MRRSVSLLTARARSGTVKYWQKSMNMVKEFSAHGEPIRGLSFAPSDYKFATASDDCTIKVWDFARCKSDTTLKGHGWDVRCVDWHPSASVLASGGKDNLIKLWDPRAGGDAIATMHGHRNTLLRCSWNANERHLLTAGCARAQRPRAISAGRN